MRFFMQSHCIGKFGTITGKGFLYGHHHRRPALSCRCVDLADVHLVDYKNEISDYLVIPMEGNAARRICKSFPSSFTKIYVFTGAALVADNI